MKSVVILLAAIGLALSRNYPMYKQCDQQWAREQLGTSSNTICSAGCLMSSAAMALSSIGKDFNPSTLNTWLKGHGGYVSGDLFVWSSINSLGLTFQAKIANSQISSNIEAGNIVIINVHNGGHWVLVTGVSGSTLFVNDPYFSTPSYDLSQIVPNNSGLYKVIQRSKPFFIDALEIALKINKSRQSKKEISFEVEQ